MYCDVCMCVCVGFQSRTSTEKQQLTIARCHCALTDQAHTHIEKQRRAPPTQHLVGVCARGGWVCVFCGFKRGVCLRAAYCVNSVRVCV